MTAPRICQSRPPGGLTVRALGNAVWYVNHVSASGLGTVLGTATAGTLTITTGDAFAPGSIWIPALPGLATYGLLAGLLTARLSRHWLLPQLPHRQRWSALAGIITLPLATAVGQAPTPPPATLPLILLGATTTLVHYRRALRQRHRTPTTGNRHRTKARNRK